MTILFSDIRSYTTLSESMSPEENFKFLNSYLSRIGPKIRACNGFVNQFQGDGIMALFLSEAENAVRASIEMQKAVSEYNDYRRTKNRAPIKVGIGLHTGPLMLGIMGERDRMDANVVSDAVNTASRMEGLTKFYGASIAISEDTLSRIDESSRFNSRFLGKVQVKGKQLPVSVFEITDGDTHEIIDLKSQTKADFEAGLNHYFTKEFAEATVCFKKVLDVHSDDKTAELYLKRAAQFVVEGVSDEWEGVEAMDSK
jgi:two-component system sensor histidine kinase ChiS